jgi:hypothetical protein
MNNRLFGGRKMTAAIFPFQRFEAQELDFEK